MSITSTVTSATSKTGFFSSLSKRPIGAKVLAGSAAVSLGANMFLGGSEEKGFFGSILKFTDNIACVLGILSIFPPFAVLTLPIAGYYLARGIMEIFSGNFLSGSLGLIGALPIFGFFKAQNLLKFKSMMKVPVDDAALKITKVDKEALKVMGKNIKRLEDEGKVLTEACEQVAKKVGEAEKSVKTVIDDFVKKGVVKQPLVSDPLKKQVATVNKTLRDQIKLQSEKVTGLEKAVEEARKTSAKNLEKLEKELVEAKNKLAESQKYKRELHQKHKILLEARIEAKYTEKALKAHNEIMYDAAAIRVRAKDLIEGRNSGRLLKEGEWVPDTEVFVLDGYKKFALQTIKTDYVKAAQLAVGRSYGSVSEAQFERAAEFIKQTKDSNSRREAIRGAIKGTRTWWRDILHGTAPDPIKEVAKAA